MCFDLFVGSASLIQAGVGAVGVPLLLWYTWETRTLRKIAQQQLKVAADPNVFFDDAGRENREHWEELYVINGGSGPALKVRYRVGQKGLWRRLPSVLSGQRAKLPVQLRDLINDGMKEKTDEGTIFVEYYSSTGERFESRAVLKTEGLNFYLEATDESK
jgi:hypothetical protein